ncbi:MAG: ferredoxin--NADP reductase [Planctomycetota bacterium]
MWREVRVEGWRRWAPGLATLRLQGAPPPFEAGQFFNLALDLPRAGAEPERVSRSYSASSAPGAPLEVFLVEVPGGALTPQLFALEPGSPLLLNPLAAGHFVLSRVPEGEVLWLIATGTGLGPYVAMLRAGEALQRFQRVVLVHGVRTADHLAYREELLACGERLSWVPAVSRERLEGAIHGRLTDALRSGELEARAGARLDAGAQVLLCGNPGMVGEARALLEARGLARNRPRKPGQITIEKYWG